MFVNELKLCLINIWDICGKYWVILKYNIEINVFICVIIISRYNFLYV